MPPDANEPIDFHALDPDADPDAQARFVSGVVERITTRPNPYPIAVGPLWGIWSLARPLALAAAFVIVALGLAIGVATMRQHGPQTVAESLGVPPDLGVPGGRR